MWVISQSVVGNVNRRFATTGRSILKGKNPFLNKWNDTERGNLNCWEKNIIQRGWLMDGCIWSNGGMVLTGENCSIGRKTLYSVGGRWMDEYGSMVE